jgi:ABC-type Fe3+ transport system substrate-binding protein
MGARIAIIAALVLILGVPLGARLTHREDGPADAGARRLVVISPHVPQIRSEFARGFDRWHRRVHGEGAVIDWRAPGGTTEILKLLEAQYTNAAKGGAFDFKDPKDPKARAGTIPFDLMFGGGSFDHGRLKSGVKVELGEVGEDGKPKGVTLAMSVGAGFSKEQLVGWFGANAKGEPDARIGAGLLFDKDQFWIGTALSGFGIVYNREMLASLGLPEPASFHDLAHPGLVGQVILADPRQSGSITTAIDSILNAELWDSARREGWDGALEAAFVAAEKDRTLTWEGALRAQAKGAGQSDGQDHWPKVEAAFERAWGLLRRITANARTYTAAATRPPMDISAGEGAAGLAIDFYGRGQAQAVEGSGDAGGGRVGYVDPKGQAFIDADPASILRGGPDPELARRFIEFCLSEEGQSLWQLHSARHPAHATNPKGPAGEALGPQKYELRRMPVRRAMFAPEWMEHYVDKVDPFVIASTNRSAGWRPAIGPLLGAFSIDIADEQRRAWRAIIAARARGDDGARIAAMERAFDAMPTTPTKDGELAFTAANFRAIREAWRNGDAMARLEVRYTQFFRAQYAEVERLARGARASADANGAR